MHKYFGYGEFFCWHCGRRIHKGKKCCPHCGARYAGKNYLRQPVKRRITTHPGLGPFHPTVIDYLVKYVLFSVLFAFGWCCIMYFFMDITFEDERKYVYYILWGFWIIWLAFFAIGKMMGVYKVYRHNNAMRGKGVIHCAMCGAEEFCEENYCGRCGTVLFVDHSEADHPPVGDPKKK